MNISCDKLNFSLRDSKVQVMNFLNEVALKYPDAISFAPGRPLEEFFDVEDSLGFVKDYVQYQLKDKEPGVRTGYAALGQYGRTNGIIGELIAKLLLQDEGIVVDALDIVLTVGCQEAMCLCLLVLCANAGDVALVVDPAYIGISGAARVLGVEIVAVPCGDFGVDLHALEQTVGQLLSVGKTPRVLYTSPDFANPTGITTSAHCREQLLELTRRLDLMVLEDHAYNYFNYDELPQKALKSMPNAEHVIYLGSFSKSIYPGLRLGFIAADQRAGQSSLADEFSKVKSLLTVNTSPLCQAIAGGLLLRNDCSLRVYVEQRRRAIQLNRDTMLQALELNFPREETWSKSVSWNRPSGGFFLGLRLPFMVGEADLLDSAEQYGVLWTPMSYFFLDKTESKEIRLSFSYVTPEQIQLGIAALSRMIRKRISVSEPLVENDVINAVA